MKKTCVIITQESFKFARAERLKSTKHIQTLFQKGKAFSVSPYRVHYRLVAPEQSPSPIQVGFAVPSRAFSRATDRNRIKRLTREAWRLSKNGITRLAAASSSHLHLFFVYNGREIPTYAEVTESFSVILKKLERLIPGAPLPPGIQSRRDETGQ